MVKINPFDLSDQRTENSARTNYSKQENSKTTYSHNNYQFINNHVPKRSEINSIESDAITSIKKYIFAKSPTEFEDLSATLFRAMGLYISYIAEGGADGGIDIVCYQDPIGLLKPVIKVQVKHKPYKTISVEDVRSFKGVLNSEDHGIFVTSGTYTRVSIMYARDVDGLIELIDINKFIWLWKIYYYAMSTADRMKLPIYPVFFLN